MLPTLWNIIDTIKGIINGDISSSVDDIINIPFDWISDNYSKLFDWIMSAFNHVRPFFVNAGQTLFETFRVDSLSDVIELSFAFMGIAGVLLFVKLIFWFMGG